jgi:hypothetical protein
MLAMTRIVKALADREGEPAPRGPRVVSRPVADWADLCAPLTLVRIILLGSANAHIVQTRTR